MTLANSAMPHTWPVGISFAEQSPFWLISAQIHRISYILPNRCVHAIPRGTNANSCCTSTSASTGPSRHRAAESQIGDYASKKFIIFHFSHFMHIVVTSMSRTSYAFAGRALPSTIIVFIKYEKTLAIRTQLLFFGDGYFQCMETSTRPRLRTRHRRRDIASTNQRCPLTS